MSEHPMDRAAQYGVNLWDTYSTDDLRQLQEGVDHSLRVPWADPRLKRIIRLRLIGCSWEYPFWDVSYVYGELTDGRRCLVMLPDSRLPRNWRQTLVEWAQRDGVYAKGLGCFDPNVVSTLAG